MVAVVLTLVISFLIGGSVWLGAGSRLALNSDKDANEVLNLIVYVAIAVVPVFFGVFFLLDQS